MYTTCDSKKRGPSPSWLISQTKHISHLAPVSLDASADENLIDETDAKRGGGSCAGRWHQLLPQEADLRQHHGTSVALTHVRGATHWRSKIPAPLSHGSSHAGSSINRLLYHPAYAWAYAWALLTLGLTLGLTLNKKTENFKKKTRTQLTLRLRLTFPKCGKSV